MQLTIFVGFLLLHCGAVCIKGTLDTCYPGLAYHQTLILQLRITLIIAISLCCTLLKCTSTQIFVSIIENSWALDLIFFFQNWLIVFFVCNTIWTVQSLKLWTHHTNLQLFWKEFTMRICSRKPASSNPCCKLILETLSEREEYILLFFFFFFFWQWICIFCSKRKKNPRPNTVERNPDKILIVYIL